MKTQAIRNNESAKSTTITLLVAMIILCEFLLFTNSAHNPGIKTEMANSALLIPVNQPFFTNHVIHDLELNKLNERMKLTKAVIADETNTRKQPATKNTFSEAMKNDFLVAEIEPELEISVAKSITFPESASVALPSYHEIRNNPFIKEMKLQVADKINSEVELYALERKMEECLRVVVDEPLQIEFWMINKKCWCPEAHDMDLLADE